MRHDWFLWWWWPRTQGSVFALYRPIAPRAMRPWLSQTKVSCSVPALCKGLSHKDFSCSKRFSGIGYPILVAIYCLDWSSHWRWSRKPSRFPSSQALTLKLVFTHPFVSLWSLRSPAVALEWSRPPREQWRCWWWPWSKTNNLLDVLNLFLSDSLPSLIHHFELQTC